jgi:ribosomal protein L29
MPPLPPPLLPTRNDLIAHAVCDRTVQILQRQVSQLHHDQNQLLEEQATLRSELNNLRIKYAAGTAEKEGEIHMLRGEVSRLLGKNVKETLEYTALLDEHERVREELEEMRERERESEGEEGGGAADVDSKEGKDATVTG